MSATQAGWPHGDDTDGFVADLDEAAPEPAAGGYRSPLMRRISGTGKLTLDTLRADVPVFHAGKAAEERLAAGGVPAEERAVLLQAVAQGTAAKERLMLAGVPLVKHLAQKEHQRRQKWQTAATFEDLFQEGMYGLLRGLAKYNPHGNQSSPTNYLGQWILTTMRREIEEADNDFGVPFDTAERFRRIRALRSRLHGELGREPTDAEMIKAWDDPAFVGGRKIGRVNKAAAKPGKGLTEAHLAEEREMRYRVGHTSRLAMGGTSEPDGPLVEFARPLGDEPLGDASDAVVERGAQEGLGRIVARTLDQMNLPDLQRDIIARRWGLHPYAGEESARDISTALKIHRERVSKIIEAFTQEMSRPGAAFHQVCATLTDAELVDLNLGWVPTTLGRYDAVPPAARAQQPPEVLRAVIAPRGGNTTPPPPPAPPAAGRGPQVYAQFLCDYHDRTFAGAYQRREDVPRSRVCPECQRPSRLIRLMQT